MIKILVTGGTIDSEGMVDDLYFFDKTHLPIMLEQGRNMIPVEIDVLFLKDSVAMKDSERETIFQTCKSCKEERIVITHGTDTMIQTAHLLKGIKDKTIVITGAMVPYNQPDSDALFNIGCGIMAVQLLLPGIYIVMNGKIFNADGVKKNHARMCFEEHQ